MVFEFIQAKNCGPDRFGQRIDLVVIHTMEAPEKPGTARAVATWFASSSAPKASAHYCIDDREIVQCVPESVVAWGAPGANRAGIHLEHAGYASQNLAQWDDEYSRAVLATSARLCADICDRYAIPIVRLEANDLADPNARGICGHVDVTNGRNGGKGHTDPGSSFPWDRYIGLVLDELARARARDTLPNAGTEAPDGGAA